MVDRDIIIRPAHKDDLDQLRALDVRVFGRLAYPYFVLRQMFDVYDGCWLVADHPSDGLAGYSLGVPTPDRKLGWLLALAVAPDCRNRGYGRLLTLESLNLLASTGVPAVHLTVEPGNEAAIRLYRRLGFVVADRRSGYFGPGEDRVIMARAYRSFTPNAIPAPRPISGVRER